MCVRVSVWLCAYTEPQPDPQDDGSPVYRRSFFHLQIKNESFLEDLNNILNAGDVPNIYAIDELDAIYTAMKPVVQDSGIQPTKTNLFSAYTKRVRSNLHTVITMR